MIWTLFSQLVIDTSVPLFHCLCYASPTMFMFTHNNPQNELSGHYIEALKILKVKTQSLCSYCNVVSLAFCKHWHSPSIVKYYSSLFSSVYIVGSSSSPLPHILTFSPPCTHTHTHTHMHTNTQHPLNTDDFSDTLDTITAIIDAHNNSLRLLPPSQLDCMDWTNMIAPAITTQQTILVNGLPVGAL